MFCTVHIHVLYIYMYTVHQYVQYFRFKKKAPIAISEPLLTFISRMISDQFSADFFTWKSNYNLLVQFQMFKKKPQLMQKKPQLIHKKYTNFFLWGNKTNFWGDEPPSIFLYNFFSHESIAQQLRVQSKKNFH
jgi:hypothetical protein